MLVAEDLHLDVPGRVQVALQEHGAVAERGRRLPLGAGHRAGQVSLVADHPHAPAAAAERRLDQHREADASRGCGGRRVRAGSPSDRPGSTGTPAAAISSLAAILEPMASIASGGGPTKVSPACAQSRAKPAFSDRKP